MNRTMMAVAPLLSTSLLAYATLLICFGLFVVALLWVIRPNGVSILSQIAPREQAFKKAQALLQTGDWQAAFTAAGKLRDPRKPNPIFDRRINNFEGECLYRAAEEALAAHRFSEGLELMRGAGDRLGLPEAEFDKRVVAVLLAEVRRRVALPAAGDDIEFLVQEVSRATVSCPEASFWLALRHLMADKPDEARACLHDALGDANVADAALYLGALDRKSGREREAARWLDHAVRLAPECPVIQWQYGAALLESGGDPARAVRALEFAVGPKGLAKHINEPQKIWANSLPGNSWLAKVTRRTPVPCPLGLDQPAMALVEARRLLGAAFERCDRPTDAATIYYQALSSGDDSLPVLRGLGLSLARSGMYDDAKPHLEAARTREMPPTPLTVGYLALCTARTKTASAQDRQERLSAGLNVLTSLNIRGDAEWLKLTRELLRDVTAAHATMTPVQQLELAQIFASGGVFDQQAAQLYDLLAETVTNQPPPSAAGDPDVKPVPQIQIPAEAAWLYIRAATESSLRLKNDATLFARAFRERDAARKYYSEKQWDFAPVEKVYLERWAEKNAGRYPDAPGPLYPAIAERVLMEESRRHDAAGRVDAARAALDLARKLGPNRALTLDRLAELAYRRGDRMAAEALLGTWIEHHPNDPRPLVRRGVLARLDGRIKDSLKLLLEACEKAIGPVKVRYLLLAARVAIAAGEPEQGAELINRARATGPIDAEALTALAALWWQRGEFDKLAELREELEAVRGDDPFRALLAGLCHHLSGEETLAEIALDRASTDATLTAETSLLRSIVLGWQGRDDEARTVLSQLETTGATRDLVFGLTGQFAWKAGDYTGALTVWEQVAAAKREAWKLNSYMSTAAFLAGVANLAADQPADALAAFRRAGVMGCRDERLPALEARAVQRVIQGGPAGTGAVTTEQFGALERKLTADGLTPAKVAWLARGYRRQGHPVEARRLLESITSDEPHVLLQRGLLFLHERQLPAAEAEFSTLMSRSTDSPAAVTNLALIRLSMGKFDGLPELLDRAAERAGFAELKRTLQLYKSLLPGQAMDPSLATISAQDELRLLWRLQRLGRLETTAPMIERLAEFRPESPAAQQAKSEVLVLWTLHLIDRGEADEALKVDGALAASGGRALRNLLGVAACLLRQFGKAIKYFQASLPGQGDDARVQQNLALASAWKGDRTRAVAHWNRCLTNLNAHCPAPPGDADYLMRLGRAVRQRMEGDEAGTPRPEEVAT